MKKQENQVIIIRENKLEADNFIRELRQNYLSPVKAVCVKLKSMGIERFPLSVVTDCISGNFDQVNALFSKIIEAEKSKVESNELKASIEANMSAKFSGFVHLAQNIFTGELRNDQFWGETIQNIEEIKNIRSRLIIIPKKSKSLFKLIELNDQLEPVLVEEKIREFFFDVATPKQAAIIEAQTLAAKALTEMSDGLIANGQRHDFQVIMSFAKKFFTVTMDDKSGRYEVSPNTDVIALL